MGLADDLYGYLRDEELKSSFERVLFEYVDQLGRIRAPRFQRAKKPEDRTLPPEAKLLWGPDKSQWHIGELAVERAIDKERESGVAEDVLVDVERALQLWRERAGAEIKERRRRKASLQSHEDGF